MTMDVAKTPIYDPSEVAFVEDRARPVLGHGRDLHPGAMIRAHSHPRSQLLWAAEGVLRVHAGDAVWIVPPSHAVWIPGGVRHQVSTQSGARSRNLYLDPSIRPRARVGTGAVGSEGGADAAEGCEVLLLTPLLREIILRLAERPRDAPAQARGDRLAAVAIDEIGALPAAPLSLPGGQDPRLRRLTEHLGLHPEEGRPLDTLAAIAGASPRTLERLFRAETGLSFRQWRARARVLAALDRLERGETSTRIAYSLGYRSPSAFIAAFHSHFGCAPQSFFTPGREGHGPA